MNTPSPDRCSGCDAGLYQLQRLDYEISTGDGNKVIVPDLPIEVCDHCGEVLLSAEAAAEVDRVIAAHEERLSPREIERIREDLGVDQTEMSEIVGLGGKTYHRWEKGNQNPSRSMGYYLRVLVEFPEAFQWLRDRGWRKKNRLASAAAAMDFGKAFPSLAQGSGWPNRHAKPSFNPATALFGKKG